MVLGVDASRFCCEVTILEVRMVGEIVVLAIVYMSVNERKRKENNENRTLSSEGVNRNTVTITFDTVKQSEVLILFASS